MLIGDATKAKHKLGWTPKHTLDELIVEMVEGDIELVRRNHLLQNGGYHIENHLEDII